MKRFYLTCLVGITCLIGGCAGRTADSDSEKILAVAETDAAAVEAAATVFDLSASFQDDNIVITESGSGTALCEIPIPFDKNELYLSMTDENNGCLLYCSTPGAGQMMKYLYVTKDRWTTCEEKDISSLIDGYPTSLSALSSEHIYIGTQMRSNGYLFETTDGGEHWDSVTVDEGYYRYGYVPLLDENNGVIYAFLEYEADGRSHYNLYQSDMNAATWEKIGGYSLDTGETSIYRFFMTDGTLYFYDSQGNHYQITL